MCSAERALCRGGYAEGSRRRSIRRGHFSLRRRLFALGVARASCSALPSLLPTHRHQKRRSHDFMDRDESSIRHMSYERKLVFFFFAENKLVFFGYTSSTTYE